MTHMEHMSDRSRAAQDAACEVRDLFAGFGVTSVDILPAQDRVVVHLPLSEARTLVDEAKAVRGASTRAEWRSPHLTQPEDDFAELAWA